MNARVISQLHPSQSERFNRNRKRRVWIGLTAGVLAIASWLFVFSWVSYLPALAIDSVEVYGADPDIKAGLAAAATGTLQGSYLGMFSKGNALIYSGRALKSAVAARSPRVETISLGKNGLNTLTVSVSEKSPSAVVCADLPDLDANGSQASSDCYLADHSGLIYMKAPAASTSNAYPYDIYYAPDLPADPIGRLATSTAEFTAVSSFLTGVRAAGLKPQSVLMKDGGEYELYLVNPTDATQPLIVYFNTTSDTSKELSNLSAFWNGMSSTSRSSGAGPGQFEYIDVRYGSNVFYR